MTAHEQDVLAASYADQAELLQDETATTSLNERIAELRSRPPAPVMSTEEFFAAFPD